MKTKEKDERVKSPRTVFLASITGANYPQPTTMPGIEATSDELPDLYKNMTL